MWNFSYIKVEPGQGERYMDFLATQWKKQNELDKQKKGYRNPRTPATSDPLPKSAER